MSARPLSVLVAALGGEGGGLLADWLVAAALAADLPVQSTSIPGVAQRTGATTYYLEIFPETNAALGGKRPLFALYPTPGAVDLVAATELLEAGRMIEGGFVTPERTTLVAGIHRVYATIEKMQMGDGRFDAARVLKAAQEMARRPILFDLTAERHTATQPINAVLLGAIAATGELPIARGMFEQAICDSGIAVESNLAAFGLGWEIAEKPPVARLPLPGLSADERAIVEEGVKRLGDYQDAAYPQLYLSRLERVRAALGENGGDLVRETARYLALWMAYEDVIRVAQLKGRPERLAGIRAEIGAKLDEPVHVREFFKPGLAELAAILPPRLGAGLSGWAERRGIADRLHLPLRLRSTTVSAHLMLRLLAAMKPWRRRSYRFAEEQQRIERWLDAVSRAAAFDPTLALEVALCGRLIKGYGDTRKRGLSNFTAIMTALAEPALARRDRSAAAAMKRAREAALADPDGNALSRALAAE
jgi:indolepyruvate ferredoxin oxidoreductase beta subunit